MSQFVVGLAVCGLIYALVCLTDALFKSCLLYPYLMFMSRHGIQVQLFRITYFTTGFNRLFHRIGHYRPKFMAAWFTLGAYVSSLLVIPALVLLVKTLVEAFIPATVGDERATARIVLQPVMPGVNMPLSEIGYYFVTLLVCSIFHEAGHAVAAVTEDVRVLGFGFFLMFVVPAAYVDLPTDQLMALRPFRQLKVFTAGVWHNVVLTAIAYLVFFSIPPLSRTLYHTNQGLYITHVQESSSVLGPTGLKPGDIIRSLNHDCMVTNTSSWKSCIVQAITLPNPGHCIQVDIVKDMHKPPESPIQADCCDETENTGGNLCFKSVEEQFCLPVRNILTHRSSLCNSSSPCKQQDDLCLHPYVGNNDTKLVQIQREDDLDFLFVGSPVEIYQGITTSNYIPKFSLLSARLPDMLHLLCYYLASFSGALAVLNVVPCFYLDGQHMIRVLVDLLCGCHAPHVRSIISLTFCIVGSVLLAANILVGVWQLL